MTTDAREGETANLYAQHIKFLWVSIQPTKPNQFYARHMPINKHSVKKFIENK